MSGVFGLDAFIPGFHPHGKEMEGATFWWEIIKVDAFLTEDHSFSTKITEYPVENGAYMHTHVHRLSPVVNITGIVTDTPIGIWNPLTGLLETMPGRSMEIINKLIALRDTGEPMSVSTTLGVYDDYLFKSFDVNRKESDGYSIPFSAKMKHFKRVYLQKSDKLQIDNRVTRFATPRRQIGTKVAQLMI